MIDLIFQHANEMVIVRIKGHDITFGSTIYGARMANIEGLRLDFNGTIREFPDLKEDLEWRSKAIKRFKEKINELSDEEKIADYIIYELRTKGYIPKLKQRAGFRPVAIRWMSFIDEILGSAWFVYLLLLFFGIHLYLKRSGKTLPEAIKDLKESLNSLGDSGGNTKWLKN